MHILFIADPLSGFKPHKDSTFAMMRQAHLRGHTVSACELHDLRWHSQAAPHALRARARRVHITGSLDEHWFAWDGAAEPSALPLRDFDAIIMRKDPPFDSEFFYATHLLAQAVREGAKVFNDPAALRNHPEKLALMEFAQWTAPTVVSRDMAVLRAFHATHRDVIFKPLDGMGGSNIFRVRSDGLNLGSVLENLTDLGRRSIMAQLFLPAISAGDRRVLLIDGVAVPFALARIPQGDEVRANLAAGGKGEAVALNARERTIAQALGPVLGARGLLLVGLDIIGDYVTEINVTSPTCFQEITDQTGCDVAQLFMDALERKLAQGTTTPHA